jgi:hypothetical protein
MPQAGQSTPSAALAPRPYRPCFRFRQGSVPLGTDLRNLGTRALGGGGDGGGSEGLPPLEQAFSLGDDRLVLALLGRLAQLVDHLVWSG